MKAFYAINERVLLVHLCRLSILLFGSCSSKTETVVDQWLKKTVVIPNDLVYTRYGTDTLDFSTDLSDYTILMYVDTVGCTSCQLQLERWQDWIKYLKNSSPYNISFLFDFHPKDEEELLDLLQYYQFDVPVCIDREDCLNQTNKFPKESKYHTMLLDKEHRVVLIGNPVNNEQIADLYRKVLLPSDSNHYKKTQTPIFIPYKEINLRRVQKDNIKAQFVIKNGGAELLVIQHLETSCGCTSVNYPKRPISSGDSAIINVHVKKQNVGFFHEVIRVYGNMQGSPITFTLTGKAI